jgi:hypothetical protein
VLGLDEDRTLRADGGGEPTGAGGSGGAGGLSEGGASAAYVAAVLADSPIAYWRFEEQGGELKNEIDQSPDGTPEGNVGYRVPGAVGFGLRFDGSATVRVGDFFDFAGPDEMSIEVWAKADRPVGGFDFQHLVHKRVPVLGADPPTVANGYSLSIDGADGLLNFTRVQDGEYRHAKEPMLFDELTYFVATFEDNISTLYFNGALVTTKDNAGIVLEATSEPFRIGGGEEALKFEGMLDEVAIYDKALTLGQIEAHYHAAKP